MKLFYIFLGILITTGALLVRCRPERVDPIVNTFKKTIDLKGVKIKDIYGLYQRSDGNYAILVRVVGVSGIPASGIIDRNGNLIGNLKPHPSIEGDVDDAISDEHDGFIIIGRAAPLATPYVARISKEQNLIFKKNIPLYDGAAEGHDVRAIALAQTNEVGIVGMYHKGNFIDKGSGFSKYNTEGVGVPSVYKTTYDNIIPYDIETTRDGHYIVVGSTSTRGYIKLFYDIGTQYEQKEFIGKKMYQIQSTNDNNYVILYGETNGNVHLMGISLNLQILWDINQQDFISGTQTISLIKSNKNDFLIACVQDIGEFSLLGISSTEGKVLWRSTKPISLVGRELYLRKLNFTQDKGTISACIVSDSLCLIKTDEFGNILE